MFALRQSSKFELPIVLVGSCGIVLVGSCGNNVFREKNYEFLSKYQKKDWFSYT